MESNYYICTAQTNLTLGDLDALDKEARERGVSRSQLMRDIIHEWVSGLEGER